MKMSEDALRHLHLQAYIDGELDAAAALEMERRLTEEPSLAADHARLVTLSRVLRERLERPAAPASLRAKVLAIAEVPPTADIVPFPARGAARRTRLALAATLLIGLGLGGGATYFAVGHDTGMSGSEAALDETIAGHVRALAAGTPFDVASSDRHTVKPWFAGKVTFAPEVVDLADQGFPLAGGRLDVIAGRIAATLVFRHDKHLISLTEALDPNGIFNTSERRAVDGFSVRHWWDRGIAYWAGSDAAADEMDIFVAAFQAKAKAI